MKKILSIILTAVLLISAFAFPAGAAETENTANSGKYYDEFLSYLWGDDYQKNPFYEIAMPHVKYNEVFTHNTGGVDDWVLIYADGAMTMDEPAADYILGRLFTNNSIMVPFTYGYGVYNIAEKKFYDLTEIRDESIYPDIKDVLEQFGIGRLLFEQEKNSEKVFFAYPKKNLGDKSPLMKKSSAGTYNFYCYCVPYYGNSNNFGLGENGEPVRNRCYLLFENDEYLYFRADMSNLGTMEQGADYILQFSGAAVTYNLTMTADCLGDTVVITGETVFDSDMQTQYLVEWKNNPQCGMQAQLLYNNTLWNADKGCAYLLVNCPKAAFISDALNKYLLTSYSLKDTVKANLNVNFADAEKNRANCSAFGIDPVDVYTQYADDNSPALLNGEPAQLELNGQQVSAVLYNNRYYADLSCIASALGLTDEEKEAYEAKEAAAVGDVNNDGIVNIVDATVVQKTVAKITALNYRMMQRADFSGNGKVDIDDATCIQKSVAKLI